jgi:hypothetical protein
MSLTLNTGILPKKPYFLYVFKGYITLAQTGLPVAGKSPRPLLQKLRQLSIIKFNYSFVLKMLNFSENFNPKKSKKGKKNFKKGARSMFFGSSLRNLAKKRPFSH